MPTTDPIHIVVLSGTSGGKGSFSMMIRPRVFFLYTRGQLLSTSHARAEPLSRIQQSNNVVT